MLLIYYQDRRRLEISDHKDLTGTWKVSDKMVQSVNYTLYILYRLYRHSLTGTRKPKQNK